MERNFIILLFGKSGSGKTTVAEELNKLFGWTQIQSYTDRAKRYPGETGHIFLSPEEFDRIPDGNMVAYTEFSGHRYCATAGQVEENDIYVIDPKGIKEFKKRYMGNKVPIPVYLASSDDLRATRMMNRGDALLSIKERLDHDKKAFRGAGNMAAYKIMVTCDKTPENIANEIYACITGEKRQVS